MTEKMKTVCVGRFLVDLPARAEFSLSRERIDGFAIDTVEESAAEFRARMQAREADIVAIGPDLRGSGKGGMVEARDTRIPGAIGRVLLFGHTRDYLMAHGERVYLEMYSVEAHVHLDGISFSLSARISKQADAAAAEALLARLQLRGDDEIPAVPGFCIDRAIFAEPLPPHDTEHVAMHVGLPDHPDIALAFASMPGGDSGRSLLTRYADMDAEAGPDELLRVTRLRSGKRGIHGMGGEEVLERVREFNFATTYGFMWETRGVSNDNLQPFLSLELHGGISPRPGGKPADTSLHEDAVLALWDQVSSSIRLRPAGPPPAPDAPPGPPQPGLGALATAGAACPHTGWWKCREGGPGVAVQGGAVQWIRKDERMPQVLLLPSQTLWQKLRGLQPSIEPERPTTWQLVDKRLRPRMPAVVPLAQPGPGPGTAGLPPAADGAGLLARTGDPCLVSGWWRCAEAQALDGTRWFARGSVLPAATFQVPARLFGRSAGPDVIQRRGTWQLMRPAEADLVAPPAAAADPVAPPVTMPPRA